MWNKADPGTSQCPSKGQDYPFLGKPTSRPGNPGGLKWPSRATANKRNISLFLHYSSNENSSILVSLKIWKWSYQKSLNQRKWISDNNNIYDFLLKIAEDVFVKKRKVEKNTIFRSACDMFVPCYSEETYMLFLPANKILSNKVFWQGWKYLTPMWVILAPSAHLRKRNLRKKI